MIAVVREKWLGPQAGGKLRIMNEAGPVRVELETALKRDITVLPVLLDGTSMPDPADLPEPIRDFAYRNAIEVESGRDFNMHMRGWSAPSSKSSASRARCQPPRSHP